MAALHVSPNSESFYSYASATGFCERHFIVLKNTEQKEILDYETDFVMDEYVFLYSLLLNSSFALSYMNSCCEIVTFHHVNLHRANTGPISYKELAYSQH